MHQLCQKKNKEAKVREGGHSTKTRSGKIPNAYAARTDFPFQTERDDSFELYDDDDWRRGVGRFIGPFGRRGSRAYANTKMKPKDPITKTITFITPQNSEAKVGVGKSETMEQWLRPGGRQAANLAKSFKQKAKVQKAKKRKQISSQMKKQNPIAVKGKGRAGKKRKIHNS